MAGFLEILKLGVLFSLAISACALFFHLWTQLSVRLVTFFKRLLRTLLCFFRRKGETA